MILLENLQILCDFILYTMLLFKNKFSSSSKRRDWRIHQVTYLMSFVHSILNQFRCFIPADPLRRKKKKNKKEFKWVPEINFRLSGMAASFLPAETSPWPKKVLLLALIYVTVNFWARCQLYKHCLKHIVVASNLKLE